jgi:phosphatidylserine/phosphatidylglycerophosphate/cardiolipin synthase-like enzyme
MTVRLVTDSDNQQGEAIEMLQGVGVPIVGDRRSALMHDKFLVIDHAQVWAGSMNLTTNDAYLNDNNFLRFDSPALAAVFEAEFYEMFTTFTFGAGTPAAKHDPIPLSQGCTVQPWFAPDDAPARAVIAAIGAARRRIHFLAFSFTAGDIGAALIAAGHRGLEVRGVAERMQANSNQGAQAWVLGAAGLDARLDGNPRNMHHKVMIFDGETVLAGSYNFTASAEHNNDEDMLILRCPPVADLFEREYRRVYALASPIPAPTP